MDAGELISKMTEFLNLNYEEELELIKAQKIKSLQISFNFLAEYDPSIAEMLLEQPDDVTKALEIAALSFEENPLGDSVGQPCQVAQVAQHTQVAQVAHNLTFPSFLSTSAQRVLWLLSVVESASQKEIADFLKLEKYTISRIVSRPDRNDGLVAQGWATQVATNSGQPHGELKITPAGRTYLQRLADNFNSSYQKPKSSFTLFVRWSGLPDNCKVSIGDLRQRDLNKFRSIESVIRRKGDVRPRATFTRYECPNCGNIINVLQSDPLHFKEPSRCSCGRKGRFKLLSKQLKDVQYLTVEDWGLNIDTRNEVKRLRVLFQDDLCDRQDEALIGNRALFYGVLREVQIESHGTKTADYDIYFEVNNFKNLDDKTIKISVEDEVMLRDYANSFGEGVILDLSSRFAPNIAGNEHIKRACLLQLVSRDIKGFKTRLRMHMHFFGHPGIAKTQLGLFSFKISHKSVYVDVAKASNVGLTASVVKDDFSKAFVLEAGALPLAGEGLAFLDEIDKSREEDLSSLGEPMEKGTITVAKASLGSQTLPGVARILSCGNLVESYKENSVINHAALGLKFHIQDRFDLLLKGDSVNDDVLLKKILLENDEEKPEEIEFFRKYIFKAFHYETSPDLDAASYGVFNDFWKSLKIQTADGEIRISPRVIESLRRIALASAKLRLSKKIELFDARLAVALMTRSFIDRGIALYQEVIM